MGAAVATWKRKRADALPRWVNCVARPGDQALSAESPVPIAVGEYGDMRASTIAGYAGGRRLKYIPGCGISVATFERLPDGVANRLRKRGELVGKRGTLCGRASRGGCGYRPDQAMLWFMGGPLPDKL